MPARRGGGGPVYLNVAEKPSVARELAKVLGGGNSQSRPGLSPFNQVFEFGYMLNGSPVQMIVTSVVGHLMGIDYAGQDTKSWASYPMDALFDAAVRKSVPDDKKNIEGTLMREARSATHLVCWLDCDREGENISYEVIETCMKSKRSLQVLRARFSDLTHRGITRAMQSLGAPDERSSLAVDARQEIDLRIGAAFTRYQTLMLRDKFDGMPKVLSYGPCQFPTLGFVVSRYWEREGFVPENFWLIRIEHRQAEPEPVTVVFKWQRERVFDKVAAAILYERCVESSEVAIMKVARKNKSKWRPLPLATVELQKLAARHLRMSSEETMNLAEQLYQETLLSYPRTETDKFNLSDEELKQLIALQVPSQNANPNAATDVERYAQSLLDEVPHNAPGGYCRPRQGKNDDQAHPPIHPTKPAPHLADGKKKDLYELVLRHFLACCSKDALADEVIVTADCAGEAFTTAGQTVIARNYLNIYKYERWGNSSIPNYTEGEVFRPTVLRLESGETTAPALLTESDLIATMDRNGIGTDATIAQHIKTIKDREYVVVQGQGMQFAPTKLGLGLVQAYDQMGFADLALPKLRSDMERDFVRIVRGEAAKADVVKQYLEEYKAIFIMVRSKTVLLTDAMAQHFAPISSSGQVLEQRFSRCQCGGDLQLVEVTTGGRGGGGGGGDHVSRLLACTPCQRDLKLPRGDVSPHQHICPICSYQVVSVSNPATGKAYTICPYCFNNPPKVDGDIENALPMMRCFQCSHATCPLATARPAVRKCPSHGCDEQLELVKKKDSNDFFVGCRGYKGGCRHSVYLPNSIDVTVTKNECPAHGAKLLRIVFKHGVHPPDWAMYCDEDFAVETCPWCETRFDGTFSIRGLVQPPPRIPGGGRAHAPVEPAGQRRGGQQQQQHSFGGGGFGGGGGGGGGFGGGGGGGGGFGGGGGGGGDIPACPFCNVECIARKSNTPANPGRDFYMCGNKDKGCKGWFKWVDEYTPADPAAKCQCGLAAEVKAANTEANRGRKFRTCPKGRNDGCDYFEWIDPPPGGGGGFSSGGFVMNSGGGGGGGDGVMCRCQPPMQTRTVTSNSAANPGRQFRTCPKARDQQCGFFEWADQPGNQPPPGGGGGGFTPASHLLRNNAPAGGGGFPAAPPRAPPPPREVLCNCGLEAHVMTNHRGQRVATCVLDEGGCGFEQLL